MLAKKFFTKELLKWNKYDNDRVMPWKYEKDPYKIWISEIILQQTRVSQGLEYYNGFIKKFPTAKSIAIAPEHEVFKLWEGLGYYTRCKNIIESISQVYKQQLTHQTINGQFIKIKVSSPLNLCNYELASDDDMKQLPFPKFITTYLKD